MAQRKYSLTRNQKAEQITEAAGDVVGTETITVNFDYTNMTRQEAVFALDQVKERLLEGKWPPA